MKNLIIYLVFDIIQISSSVLIEPIEIEISSGVSYHFSIEYCIFSVPPYITSMNAHCYCLFNPITFTSFDCSIPGPTFIFHPGDKVSMTWYNRMIGDNIGNIAFMNLYRDFDITNIHTHGLHIDPAEDDVFQSILPGQNHTYIYNIAPDHYPGIHWLHAHHHGSVSFQVTSGLFSALLIKYHNNNNLGDNSLINMKQNILIFHWIYVITTSLCDCNGVEWQTYFYYPPTFDVTNCISGRDCFQVFSFCYEYCSMPLTQRQISGYTYNIQSDYLDDFQLFLVNGQFQPIIDDLTINTYRRLRFINAISQYYIQYKFPITSCEWSIIAIDGIFLTDNEIRKINDAPWNGEYLLASGGRLDIIVICTAIGEYHIISSENNAFDPDLTNIGRVPTGIILFKIQVNNIGTDTVTTPPLSYPLRPNYLTDLRSLTTNICGCNTYFTADLNTRIVTWTEEECGYVFNTQGTHNINGIIFDGIPMTSLEYGKVYEFILIPHMHPYHQHVNPFQLQTDIGLNGFQAKAGDWFDTVGGPKNVEYKFRTYPIDFSGPQVVHCHLLPHEDLGMMTFMAILQPHQICDATTGTIIGNPTVKPTISPSFAPSIVPTAPTAPTPPTTSFPTISPIQFPTHSPTISPTISPTNYPTNFPTNFPSNTPSISPTLFPTFSPTVPPTNSPTQSPSINPTNSPTITPSLAPTRNPSNAPSNKPTLSPSIAPTQPPTNIPSNSPSNAPSIAPTQPPSAAPTFLPTAAPTNSPLLAPTNTPSTFPSAAPSLSPSISPTLAPSESPSIAPSLIPTVAPSISPSLSPSVLPSLTPSIAPSLAPSTSPTIAPSKSPTIPPTLAPSYSPTLTPSSPPTSAPTLAPSYYPSLTPSYFPSLSPSISPTISPSIAPSKPPSRSPTYSPTISPSIGPSQPPTRSPSDSPTISPSKSPTQPPTETAIRGINLNINNNNGLIPNATITTAEGENNENRSNHDHIYLFLFFCTILFY